MIKFFKILNLLKFAECDPKKKGRPLSPKMASEAEKKGIETCSQKRKDGETIYYRTQGQKEKETKAREKKREEGKNSGLKRKIKVETPSEKISAKNMEVGTVGEVPIADLKVDPSRFQYKIAGEKTATGEVGSLEGVKKFDKNLAGLILAWRDPENGETYVVNGHNRFALAKKSGESNIAIRLLNVGSDKEARATGALVNIAEGRGTAVDAAKFFRDTKISAEDLKSKGIPFRESHVQQGLALSGLEKKLFELVIDGDLPIGQGALIGGSGLSENQQRKLYDIVKKQEDRGRTITDGLVDEFVQFVKSAETKTVKSEDLFGEFEEEEDNVFDKLAVQSAISRRLSRETRIFGTVGKSKTAAELAKAGNVIDVDASLERAKSAKEATQLFNSLKNSKGNVSDILNKAANDIKKAKNKTQKDKIQEEAYEKILEELPKQAGFGQVG